MFSYYQTVEFYLDNGEFFSYSITPDRTLQAHVMNMVELYASLSYRVSHEEIYLTPAMLSAFNKEIYTVRSLSTQGITVNKIWSTVGPFTLIPKRDLNVPIFVGTLEEYKNNDFNGLFNEILSK